MISFFKKTISLTAMTAAAATANGGIITSGELSYNDQTNLITGGGNTYLAWDVGASWNYETTLEMTSAGGLYENYHIASQSEAYKFFNLANTGIDAVDGEGPQTFHGGTSNYSHKRFGNNYNNYYSYALFLSDEDSGDAGFIKSYSNISIYDEWMSIAFTDIFSNPFGYSHNSMTWLLVQDSDATNVSEPGSLALLGLGIFGLLATRKKVKD